MDLPCLDSDLVEISQLIHDWREIAPVLGLTQTDEENIIGYSSQFCTSAEKDDADDVEKETRTSGYIQ